MAWNYSMLTPSVPSWSASSRIPVSSRQAESVEGFHGRRELGMPRRGFSFTAGSVSASPCSSIVLNSAALCVPGRTTKLRHCDAVLTSKTVALKHNKLQLRECVVPQLSSETVRRRALIRRCLYKKSKTYCKSRWEEAPGDGIATSPAASFRPALDSRFASWDELSSPHQFGTFKFWILPVSTSDEVLAAATLRAQLFYTYPEFNSTLKEGLERVKARLKHELDALDLLKSRVKSEFQRDSSMQLLDMKVKCLLAVCEQSSYDESNLSRLMETNALVALPKVGSRSFNSKPLVAIGTLDIQDGTGTEATVDVNILTFQLESLAHAQKNKSAKRRQILEPGPGHSFLGVPSSGASNVKHGYIFNLCVADCIRRQGVATALMREAQRVALQMHLQILYVHVEANNNSALNLYQKLGYVVEEVESADVEKRFHRPQRILLSCHRL